jgi:hypothetical protein
LPELTKEALTEIFKKHRPSDLASLKKQLNAEDFRTNEQELLDLVDQLISDGTIEASPKTASSFRGYLFDIWTAWWFYASISIALFEVFLVVLNAQAGIALFIRIILGLGILGMIPGLLTTLVLFPKGQLVILERIALGIFLSVLISIAVGVVLGLGPYFQPSSNIIVLAAYVVLVDIAASYRSYQFSERFR